MKEKIWALLVHLSGSFSGTAYKKWLAKPLAEYFDEEMWHEVVDKAAAVGMNTIVMESIDGVKYDSHPEISRPDAFSKEWVREQVAYCRERGIALIPKLNFSATHDAWLGEYARMLSTSVYYKVTKDLIEETYEMFNHPAFIHLGMDEEDNKHQAGRDYIAFRQGKQYMKDLRHLVECVKGVGATPWIWTCPLFDMTEDFVAEFQPDELVLSPWYYNAFRLEHWTPIESRAEYVAYYNEGDYAKMNIKFVEEDPFLVNFRAKALPLMKKGYRYIPCASVFNRCDYNTVDLMEYFRDNGIEEQTLGYISAPWCPIQRTERSEPFFEETFRFFKEAREKIYG
ncbi:MAG: hypothetical protein E7657_01835 [Ruminococcaceae bacterium]|nr:hypothetical protein [Oscillospiraceae bacterium]